MKSCLIILLLMIGAATLPAQPRMRNCGTVEAWNQALLSNPSLAITREEIEEQTQRFTQAHSLPSSSRSTAAITIPVVVHVVYKTSAQNISDAQIQSQIDILNEDYGRSNSDWANTPAAFQAVTANTGIQFVLAKRDPNGSATTGIVRKATSKNVFTTSNAVKYSSQGGDDAWPSASYLNLWVCEMGSSLLGYSQFPGGAAATDGVAINYTAFGNTGTATAPFAMGRTATHEVGHWLNLHHIWGDDNGACTGSDYVDDTPNQGGENYGSPSFPHTSCTNGPSGDMFMNFMDYSDDAALVMFTTGQGTRMQALFASGGARASLLLSLGGISPTAGVGICAVPSALTTGIISAASDTIKWSDVSGATSYVLEYKPTTSSVWASTTATSSSKNIKGLIPGTTYMYHVGAVCHSGSSSYSPVSSFITNMETDLATGVEELKAEIQYTIYPNPGNGTFHLMIASEERKAKITARVIDMLGNVVSTHEYENIEGLYSYKIQIPGAAAGVYNVVISDGQNTETRKLVVQK